MAHKVNASSGGGMPAPRATAAVATTVLTVLCLAMPAAADPALGVALRAGTPGIGLDLDLGLSPYFGMRVGFSGLNINHNISTSDVNYDGRLQLRTISGLLDWYVLGGGFHLTAGVAGNDTKLDVVGQPTQSSFTIDGTTYTTSQLGSLTGQLKFGNSVSPYIGLGWGNPAGEGSRVRFLFDVGALYGGPPSVTLTAHCGVAAPPGSVPCTEALLSVADEQAKLRDKADILRWYPVVTLGVGVSF